MNNINNLGISMRNSADIQAHSISLIKDNRVVSLEDYITEIAGEGGGGNVDLSNYYTQTETDNLLNNKLNVNNPQDIIGNLRLDPTNGNSKLIINAVSPPTATDDFYCNGTGHFNGSLRVSVLTSDGDVNADGCNADTFNSHITTNDIVFKHNDVEYMIFNATDDSLNLSKNLDMKTSTLKTNTIYTNGLNDMIFNVDTLGEFLRLQVSENTVRVPNTKSFLSQNLFTDITKPLAISNDISFQGQNDTDDGYEEYFKINSTTKAVDFSKGISSIKCNDFNSNGDNDVVLKQNNIEFIRLKTNGNMEIKRLCSFISTLALDASGALSIFRNPAGGIETIDIQNNYGTGRHRFIIANNTILEMTTSLIQSTRILQCDAGIKTNTINTNGDNNLSFQWNGVSYMTFNTDRVEINQELHLANALIIDTADKLTMRPSLESGVNIFDIRNLHPVVDNPMIRFRVGEGGGETIVCEMREEYVSMARNVLIGTAYKLQTNTIDTNGDNDLVVKINDVQHMLFSSDKVEMTQPCHFNGSWVLDTADLISCSYRVEGSLKLCDFRNDIADGIVGYRFLAKGGLAGNVSLLYITSNSIDASRDIQIAASYGLYANKVSSKGNNDLVFHRNDVEYMRLSLTNKIITVANDAGLSSPDLFANEFLNRTRQYDTVFWGSHPTADSRVEYMRYNYAGESLDFNTVIDNTGLAVIGNIVDTTVSDERLKTNIEDVECNFTECVKHVKVKTFEYKDEKYKRNDKYGFIAQELQKHLPKEFNHIVKENKEQESDDKYLSINYMKLSVVLWGCCQEQQNEIEHLEARLFEVEDIIKELMGKKTTKPKSKAKAKSEK